MRVVLINQDLTGQVLDASTRPDGHARESLVRGCTFDINTRFLGDIRGSDFLNNTGPADWSGAQTYACYWRGNTNLGGSRWPADIGYLHHQPVGTIIRDAVAALNLTAAQKQKVRDVGDFVLTADPAASWDTSKPLWWDNSTTTVRTRLLAGFRAVFAPYPQLSARFEELVRRLQSAGALWDGSPPVSVTLAWPDGAVVTVNPLALPALPDPSRYTLSRWLEQQADAQASGAHYAFVFSIVPPAASVLPEADAWAWSGWKKDGA